MALVVYDRVQETTATTGTGSVTLGGAVAGYQSFAVVGNGNTTFYCLVNGTQWEVGIGTYSTTGPTLARTTVLSNSNGNTSPITLSGGSQVFVTYPSEKSVNLDSSGNVSALGTIASGIWQGSTIQTVYGGTGLTTFTAANNALYSTSSSALTAGTLPVAAGGTGMTTATTNGVFYGNGTSAHGVTGAGTTGQVLAATTSAAPSWSNISSLAITSVSGTTNQITASTTTGAVTLSLPTSITTGQHIANQSISGSATQGAFAYGTLNGSDTGIFASYQTSIAGYAYMALQNTSSNAAATTDIALYNDTASLGKYIDIGINSSAFTGTGNFSLANAGYIYTYGGDLVLGTYSANGIHFIINNGATDAMTISSTGVVSLGTALAVGSGGTGIATAPTAGSVVYGASTTAQGYTAAGTSGQVLISGGTGSPTWSTNIGGNAATTSQTNFSNLTIGSSQVLYAGNYNSYAPTLTGTGASGTWGISITGNAATATTATTANALNTSNSYTAVNLTATGYVKGGSNANPNTPTNYGLQASGSYGGGLAFTDGSGNIGLYSTGSGATLNFAFGASGSMASIANLSSSGVMTAVSMVSSSDERLKTDWANLSVDFIDRLADVKHGSFERISSGNREVGVTAQSLKEVLPEAVVEGEEGYLSVNYGGAALVAAIELAKEVKALRAEIAALKAK